MGLLSGFTSDGTVEMKYKEFYGLMKEAAKAELMMNAIKCNVPHEYIWETMTGKAFDEAGVTVAADSLRRLIDTAEKECLDTIILEKDRCLKEADKEKKETEEQPEESGEESEG